MLTKLTKDINEVHEGGYRVVTKWTQEVNEVNEGCERMLTKDVNGC